MAWSLKASGHGVSSTSAATGGLATTGADLIVVNTSQFAVASGGTQGTLSAKIGGSADGNTYTALTARTGASNTTAQLYYCSNPAVGASHVFTYGSNVLGGVYVEAWSGSLTSGSPFGQESGASSASTGDIQPGSITPGADNYLLFVGSSSYNSGNAMAIGSSFTNLQQDVSSGGSWVGGSSSHLVQGTAAAVNPHVTGDTVSYSVAMASFKPAAGGGGQTFFARYQYDMNTRSA